MMLNGIEIKLIMAVIVKLATALLPIFLLKEHCPAVASHKQSVSDYEEIIQDYLLKNLIKN